MALVDYTAHFWGEKCIGYNVLYDNMKKGEETVQEFLNFLKERIGMEEDILKCLGKNLNKTNSYISNNGSFVDAWKLTKNTLELWTEIQKTMLKNLNELSKDTIRYQEELTKIRKQSKDVDTLEAINLMQTTTTCLQKAKETYNQRCAEVIQLKNNNEWNGTNTKEYLKIRHKLNKSHEEYRNYMEKYSQIRDIYEEKMMRATKAFQENDKTHLIQMKRFFMQLGKYLEDGHCAQAQISADLCQNLENIDIDEIMLRFVEEKGTGMESPRKYNWTEADELPLDLDIVSGINSQSSSNSSAIVNHSTAQQPPPTVNDLLGLDDTWISAGTNSFFGSVKSSNNQMAIEDCSRIGGIFDNKSGDSDSERHSEIGGQNSSGTGQSVGNSSISNMPQQISSWLGRQKLPHWRLKKHSASQSSLPNASENIEPATRNSNSEFSKSYGEVKGNNSFLKIYQKRNIKSSTGDLTQISQQKSQNENDKKMRTTIVRNPLEEFGPPPPLPSTEPPILLQFNAKPISNQQNSFPPRWSTDSSTSEDESEFQQTSKIRQLQIKPLNESQQSKLNVSLDELRSAIGQISLQKSLTFENDPWSTTNIAAGGFTQSQGPLRPSLTGDANFHRKLLIHDFDPITPSGGLHEFSHSASIFSTSGSIARARPRSHTPLLPKQLATQMNEGTFIPSNSKNNSSVKMRIPITPSPSSSAVGPLQHQKVSIAMAINEFLHVWIKKDDSIRQERIFGTILISIPISALQILCNIIDPLIFTIKGAQQIKSFSPNQSFFGLFNHQVDDHNSEYKFSIECEKMSKFLKEQREKWPQASFHNLVHYELERDKLDLKIPLLMKSYWAKLGEQQIEIRIECEMHEGERILQNVNFTTKLTNNNEGTILPFSILHSEPKAKLDGNGNIIWEFGEIYSKKMPMLTMKSIVKCPEDFMMVPMNTFVHFQILDVIISNAEIKFIEDNNYTMSVFKRKIISGKYFCEPVEQ